jgi:hypothetical protein
MPEAFYNVVELKRASRKKAAVKSVKGTIDIIEEACDNLDKNFRQVVWWNHVKKIDFITVSVLS